MTATEALRLLTRGALNQFSYADQARDEYRKQVARAYAVLNALIETPKTGKAG